MVAVRSPPARGSRMRRCRAPNSSRRAQAEIVYDRNGVFLTQIGVMSRSRQDPSRVDYGYWPLATIPRARRARDARSRRPTLLRSSRRRRPRAAARRMAQSDVARQTRRRLDHRHAGCADARPSGRAASPKSSCEAATALAIVARHGHEATLAHYLRLAPYGIEQPWRRATPRAFISTSRSRISPGRRWRCSPPFRNRRDG